MGYGNTFGEMVDRLQVDMRDQSDAMETVIKAAINDVYQEVCNSFQWNWMVGSNTMTLDTSNAGEDPLPENFARMLSARIIDPPRPLTYVSIREFYLQDANPSETGPPARYTIARRELSGGTYTWFLFTYPVVDANTSCYIYYQKRAIRLSSDAHVPLVPDEWHWLLFHGARAILLETERKHMDVAARSQARYVAGLKMMQEESEPWTLDYTPSMGDLGSVRGPYAVGSLGGGYEEMYY